MLKKFLGAGIFLLLTALGTSIPTTLACAAPSHCFESTWGYEIGAFDRYEVNADRRTPEGVAYDASGSRVSGALIDRLTDEVESCLERTYPDHVIPDEELSSLGCGESSFTLPIDRQSFVIKIAGDWIPSCDRTQQLLPITVDPAGCIAKGETPTSTCACRWRAGIRCPNELVVTPSLYLYKDVLVRFALGCSNPWGNQRMSRCVSPTTDPLSDGSM